MQARASSLPHYSRRADSLTLSCQVPTTENNYKAGSFPKRSHTPTCLLERQTREYLARYCRVTCSGPTTLDAIYWQEFPWQLTSQGNRCANTLLRDGNTYFFSESHIAPQKGRPRQSVHVWFKIIEVFSLSSSASSSFTAVYTSFS